MTTSPTSPTLPLTFTRVIKAPASLVYAAFTDRDWLRRWLCNEALIAPNVGEPLFLLWRQPPSHAAGVYTALDPETRVAFSWRGSGEKDDSQVEVTITPQGNAVVLTLSHSDLPTDADLATYRIAWEARLNNLKSVLETGADLRITESVSLGFSAAYTPNGLPQHKLAELGVPVTEGALVARLEEGAQAATRLQVDDVIVEIDGKPILTPFAVYALPPHYWPGDTIEIVFYRGSEKHTVSYQLDAPTLPEIPAGFAALGDLYEKIYAELNAEYTSLLESITEEQADQKPAPGEWNVKEILAHLILTERAVQIWIGTFIQAPETLTFSSLVPALITAIAKTHPTTTEVLAEMRRCWAETVTLLRSLPPELAERKTLLWRTTVNLDFFREHAYEHLEQARQTIAAIQP